MREDVRRLWQDLPEYQGLADACRRGLRDIGVTGLGPAPAISLAQALCSELDRPLVLLCADWSSAEQAMRHAALWGGQALLFPPKEFLPYAIVAQSPEVNAARLAVLQAGPQRPPIALPVTALRRQLPPPEVTATTVVPLAVGQRCQPGELVRRLCAAGYERQEVVDRPGSFSQRGGIVDVFPLVAEHPLRIEFGDQGIASLRTFAVETQRSVAKLSEAAVGPACEVAVPAGDALEEALERIRQAMEEACGRLGGDQERIDRLRTQIEGDLEELGSGRSPLRWESYLPFLHRPRSILAHLSVAGQAPLCAVLGAGTTLEAVDDLGRYDQDRLGGFLTEGRILPEQMEAFALPADWRADLGGGPVLHFDTLGRGLSRAGVQDQVAIPSRVVPGFAGQWALATDEFRRWQAGRYRVVCLSATPERAQHLGAQLRDAGLGTVTDLGGTRGLAPRQINVTVGQIPGGFDIPALRLAVVTEAELFGHKVRASRVVRANRLGTAIQSYEDLAVGDYVVHTSHGIGQYLGTTTMTVQGKSRDYLVLRYEGTDRLYVPTEQIALVQKYVGSDRSVRVGRLGGAEWTRAKQRVRESVRKMAEELLDLYAARQTVQGFAFSPDTPWQREFEAAFPYEETPDQLQAIAEIKADMERPVPMDRLLCGDVGYGKTEVAMRAAFKAVSDGKQVAVLVPTTILAEQHFLTFTDRFAETPVRVGMLSRFRNRRQQDETITALRRGALDIVIGTHRLLQDDIDFKNLGLLVIDEEHRFGVAHKERLKQLRKTVDVLSLTATPIPRTLHMAMAGIRDMSVITTPPDNRYPIETMVVEWSPALVREAISREIARGGQVYYLHNRVQTIGRAHAKLKELCPTADIVVGHGQMPEDELESATTAFWRGEHQVLLATTIIESGLDIPNANTVIVEDADHLGLAQLYQIRGRVGRSARVAFAYFTYHRERRLSEIAVKRLEALKQFTELGSGFKIAMRDLELRGAGNLLGPEQHGFVAAVGFEMYAQLLEEAVREARGDRQVPPTRTSVDLLVDAFFEDSYIADPRIKLDFYKKAHAASTPAEVDAIREELRDRFGPYPGGVDNLLRLTQIRIAAERIGLLAIAQEKTAVRLQFPNYAGPTLMRLPGLPSGLQRRLRPEIRPKPALRLQLDGTDDATVLSAVEDCLTVLWHTGAFGPEAKLPEAEAPAEAAPREPARPLPPHPAPARPERPRPAPARPASPAPSGRIRALPPSSFGLPDFRAAKGSRPTR